MGTAYPLAESDLEQIWLYTFRTWSPEQADSYVADIATALGDLASGKRKERPVDIRDGYFRHAIGAHLVFYRHAGAAIEIVRILHQRMDADRHL